ncbi:hypothetical protein G7Z17_g7396 [Cylindrodendrum hubeiense]|uniref:Uncharacterized protein n=1 Tax=Cylindrodendrum hubeiense TaxID=595255 RepID=A0A9P5H3T1_9HYPO|nr:hypothetical protein G7Z17_g7396 [Cylindrodendrum hubeiense]
MDKKRLQRIMEAIKRPQDSVTDVYDVLDETLKGYEYIGCALELNFNALEQFGEGIDLLCVDAYFLSCGADAIGDLEQSLGNREPQRDDADSAASDTERV